MSSVLAFAKGKDHAPLEKSLSEARGLKAALWVEKEIDKLIGEIERMGRTAGQETQITFGELFTHYQDISDTLVGILQRAKRRGIVKYEGAGGDLLLQRTHDNVVITLDHVKAVAWQKEYHASGGTTATAPAPASAKSTPKPVPKPIPQAHPPKPVSRPLPSVKPAAPKTVQHSTTHHVVKESASAAVAAAKSAVAKADGTVPKPVIYCMAISIVLVTLFITWRILRRMLFGW